jgi:poly(3-hydroxybutyrate) depolymerase
MTRDRLRRVLLGVAALVIGLAYYYGYAPASLPPHPPLVIAFHGSGLTGESFRRRAHQREPARSREQRLRG